MVSPAYAEMVIARESAGNPYARNPRSSASGLYQITRDTYRRIRNRNPHLDLAEWHARTPDDEEQAFQVLTNENEANATAKLGRAPTDWELYGYHHFGARDMGRVIDMSAGQKIGDVFSDAVFKANPQLDRSWNRDDLYSYLGASEAAPEPEVASMAALTRSRPTGRGASEEYEPVFTRIMDWLQQHPGEGPSVNPRRGMGQGPMLRAPEDTGTVAALSPSNRAAALRQAQANPMLSDRGRFPAPADTTTLYPQLAGPSPAPEPALSIGGPARGVLGGNAPLGTGGMPSPAGPALPGRPPMGMLYEQPGRETGVPPPFGPGVLSQPGALSGGGAPGEGLFDFFERPDWRERMRGFFTDLAIGSARGEPGNILDITGNVLERQEGRGAARAKAEAAERKRLEDIREWKYDSSGGVFYRTDPASGRLEIQQPGGLAETKEQREARERIEDYSRLGTDLQTAVDDIGAAIREGAIGRPAFTGMAGRTWDEIEAFVEDLTGQEGDAMRRIVARQKAGRARLTDVLEKVQKLRPVTEKELSYVEKAYPKPGDPASAWVDYINNVTSIFNKYIPEGSGLEPLAQLSLDQLRAAQDQPVGGGLAIPAEDQALIDQFRTR